MRFDDASKMGVKMNYESEDKVLLTLTGVTTIATSTNSSLELKGDVNYNLINQHLQGGGSLTFTVPQKVASSFNVSVDNTGTASAKLDISIKL
jgi:hypothetical protein